MNVSLLLTQSSMRFPDHPAVLDWEAARTISYLELEKQTARAARFLKGLSWRRGDRIVLMLPNSIDFIVGYFALLRIGATPITINPLLKGDELSYIVQDVDAAGLIAHESLREEIRRSFKAGSRTGHELFIAEDKGFNQLSLGHPEACEPEEVSQDHAAVLIYTSGTTGVPKGVVISCLNLLHMNQAVLDVYQYSEKERVVSVLPFSHIFGQTALVTAVLSRGGSILLQRRFQADPVIQMIADKRATVMVGVPTMYFHMLSLLGRNNASLASLRLCVSGGAPMPGETYRSLNEVTKRPVMTQYGLTESGLAISHRIGATNTKPESVGYPIEPLRARVVNEKGEPLHFGEIGELLLKGPNIIKEYYKKPTETAEAIRGGWLHTGDMAYQDKEGYITIVDRKKEMILRSGFNIYPAEIETVLYGHPKIAEVAVVGIPDQAKGEEVRAYVAPRPSQEVTAEELTEFCRDRIARHKCPSSFVILKELPKGSTGKILKKLLKESNPV